MDFCKDIDKLSLQKAIELLQTSVDDDFRRQMRNHDAGSHYFRDVASVMPGFTNGIDMNSIRVKIDLSLLQPKGP